MSDESTTAPRSMPRDVDITSGFVGSVNAGHDVTATTSLAGVMSAQGDATLNQGGACAIAAQGSVAMSQSGAGVVVAQSFAGDSFGGGVIVSNDIAIHKGWVGVALSPRVTVSDDSKVIIGPAGAAIIAAAMFGIFGAVVALGIVLARRAVQWRPKVPVPSFTWRRVGD